LILAEKVNTRSALAVKVLGPVEVWLDGRLVALPGRLRTVTTILALSAGRRVGVDRLAEAIWGDDLPDNVRGALQVLVTRLRRVLGPDIVRTEAAGYLLNVAPDNVDCLRFERLLDEAAAEREEATHRVRLVAALAVWRGLPFEGTSSAWLHEVEAPRLEERRLGALERRIDLDLQAGLHSDVIGELRGLTTQYGLRETFWCQLMLALYRSERQADALETYRQLRQLLADELGIEPGSGARSLHQRILNSDPTLMTVTQHAAVPVARQLPVPRQLPGSIGGFVGRATELARLEALLPAEAATPSAVEIAVIAGSAGIGKTTLAVHWAHRVADRFPDGQLYVNLRGFDPSGQVMEPAEALRAFLDALEVPPQSIPASAEAQAGIYRSLLAGKRMLVLLDNARDADQVRPLLPGLPGCLVLITSRNQLSGLIAAQAAHLISVDLLTSVEARQLLASRVGGERLAAEPTATTDIIASCARLPLALTIVAARAATYPNFSLAALARELREIHGRLDALSGEDAATDLQAAFSWSYRALTPGVARLFRLLGLHPGPDISAPAAASLAGEPLSQIKAMLRELTRSNLISEHRPGRYLLHDLLRAYASDLAHRLDTAEDRRNAVVRMLDHYLHTAFSSARLLYPMRVPIAIGLPQPGVTPEFVADLGQALNWFDADYAVLLAAITAAQESGRHVHTWQLAWTLIDYQDRRGYWQDWVSVSRAAVAATREVADASVRAASYRSLSRALFYSDQQEEAGAHLLHALELCRSVDDTAGQAHTQHALASMTGRLGRHTEALLHAREALDLYRAAGQQEGEAVALNAVGWHHAKLGEYAEALSYCEESLTLLHKVGDRQGQADTWDSLGIAHHHLGNYPQALECFQRAIDLHREVGDLRFEAENHLHLGDTHQALEAPQAAEAAWRKALAIFEDLQHPDAALVRARLSQLAQGSSGS